MKCASDSERPIVETQRQSPYGNENAGALGSLRKWLGKWRVKSSGRLQVGGGRLSGGWRVLRGTASGVDCGRRDHKWRDLRLQRLNRKWGIPTSAWGWKYWPPTSFSTALVRQPYPSSPPFYHKIVLVFGLDNEPLMKEKAPKCQKYIHSCAHTFYFIFSAETRKQTETLKRLGIAVSPRMC